MKFAITVGGNGLRNTPVVTNKAHDHCISPLRSIPRVVTGEQQYALGELAGYGTQKVVSLAYGKRANEIHGHGMKWYGRVRYGVRFLRMEHGALFGSLETLGSKQCVF